MKKIFSLFVAALLSLNVLYAQEAFRHLGASVELGTTGLGVNVSLPVISNRLIVTVGYNLPEIPIKSDFDLNVSPINSKINEANNMINRYNNLMDKYGQYLSGNYPQHIDNLENLDKCNTKIKDKINFGNFKLLAEYYPTKQSFFHITAGVFIGDGTWMNISAQADEKTWSTYTKAVEINKTIPDLRGKTLPDGSDINIAPIEGLEDAAKVSIHNDTYHLRPNSGGHLNTKLTIRKIKPYVGVGFGSSVPTKKRLGFQMEIGAYYQGKPTFESEAKAEKYDSNAFNNKTIDDFVDNLVYLRWYPQLTFRFTGRIF